MIQSWSERWLRPGRASSKDVRVDLFWLLGFGLLLIASGVGFRDPWPADEPRFALIARDMLASGDWLIPRVGGDLYSDKPPLFFWLLALSLGLTDSLRASFLLPSLLAGLGCIVLVYDLARRLWNRETALIAGALLLLTPHFVWQARQAQIDATLCLWTTLSLYGLLRHLLIGPQWRWYAIGWAAAGLGVITKGVGFLPLLVLIPWMLVGRSSSLNKNASFAKWMLGPCVFLLMVGVWLVPLLVLSHTDPAIAAYRDQILFQQTIERYTAAWHHIQPFWYFLIEVIPPFWLPLTALLPWLLPRWRDAVLARDQRIVVLLSWIVIVILFFSVSAGKRGIYILPAVPAFVLVSAPFVREIARKASVQRVVFAISAAIGAACVGAAAYLWLHPERHIEISERYGLNLFGPLASISIAVFLSCILFRRRAAFVTYATTVASVLLVVSFWVNPVLNEVRSGAAFVARVEQRADPQRELGWPAFKEQYLLHLQRPITHFGHARWRDAEGEAADAALWLNSSTDRQLVLTEQAKEHCFPAAPAVALGEANRTEWFLIQGMAASPCIKNGNSEAAYHYVPPGAEHAPTESKLLSRDDSHHLRTHPGGIRSERISKHGE